MNIKLIGAVMILLACGGVGFKMAASHRYEVKSLKQLCTVIEYMECELLYRLTPLPVLCRQASGVATGELRKFLTTLAQELDDQVAPDVSHCIDAAFCKVTGVPTETRNAMVRLGTSLGSFDLEGQLKGFAEAKESCKSTLERLMQNQDVRLRGYQTLGLCAGAAVIILFI